jgi:3-phenylpropionate/trans-cinnamate dioxygenase ferredoxin reductase component
MSEKAASRAMSPEPVALLVVGGGPAALESARSYRSNGGTGRVVMLSADDHPPYFRPALSKDHLRGEVTAAELPLEEDSFYRDQEVELELGCEVVHLDPRERVVRTATGRSVPYKSCVLAVGSSPLPLQVPGGDHPAIRLLRSCTQGLDLASAAADARSVAVVGSGFIGCEAAASLRATGHDVNLVSSEPQPQHERLGPDAGARLAQWLEEDGVRLRGDVEVSAVEDGRVLHLSDGTAVSADLVLLAVGVRPRTSWVKGSGVRCRQGRIVTDSSMATAFPGLYAVGDAALAHNTAAGRRLPVEHWGEALRMGEVAGAAAAGVEQEWAEVPGFWSEIGGRTLKYQAWGDGYDTVRFEAHDDCAFTVWYGQAGVLVGVLTHGADEDDERGGRLVAEHAAFGRSAERD